MDYRHFSIQEIAEGVFAAIHREGGAAYSNTGIIDLGGISMLFDTSDSPLAASELLHAIKELTGQSPRWIINSHNHGDHWGGNQVFTAEGTIISTRKTRSGMMAWGKEIEKMKSHPEKVEATIREIEEKLKGENDPIQRKALERNLVRNRYLLESLPQYRFSPPSLTFTGSLEFHGSKRSTELIATGPAHTPEECHLVLRKEKIVFCGDLGFFDCPPFIPPDVSLEGWLDRLAAFGGSEFRVFVPGHGPVGDKTSLTRQAEYLTSMRDLVSEAVMKGSSLDQVLKIPLPAQFSDWSPFIQRNENNLRVLYKLQGGN
jgi:cyclase